MKILFDENVPLSLRQFFPNDEVTTVQRCGWSGMKNGELLGRANASFDVLVLADKNFRYQQNLATRTIAIVELPSNRWPILKALAPRIVAVVHASTVGTYTMVAASPEG